MSACRRVLFFMLLTAVFSGRLSANTDVGKNAPGDGIADGMCDVWQQYYDAWGLEQFADEDGDGISNVAESIAGTDPRDANDGFETGSMGVAGDTIAFAFPVAKGKRYRVAGSDAPGGTAWAPVPGSAFVSAQDHTNQMIVIPRSTASASQFFRLEVQENDADSDGVSDWAEWRRGTDAETLAELSGEFALDPNDRPIFADAFSGRTRFGLDRMTVHDGFVSGVPGENWGQAAYFFDDPPDVRDGDIVVHWAFRTNSAAGAEEAKLYMFLNFTDVPVLPYPEPARIALNVRPSAWCVLYCDPGWQLPNDPELYIDPPAPTFLNAHTTEKFRMTVHWAGGDRVTVTPEYWNHAIEIWQPFTPRDLPNGGPVVMSLSIANHLLGNTVFKSVFFQTYAAYPELESVLVTVRPAS